MTDMIRFDGQALRAEARARQDWMVDAITALARIESPSGDDAALARCADAVMGMLRECSAAPFDSHQDSPGGEFSRSLMAAASLRSDGRRVLLLGHFDTVWPVGTLATMPVEIRDGRLYGPGTFDMKAGLVIAGLAAALAAPHLRTIGVDILFTSDEEVGSVASRAAIEAAARESIAVLVFEPSLPGGVLKTARKGIGTFRLDAHGVAAHAGVAPQDGASAVTEIARQVLALQALEDPARGTTINTGVISGGTRTNVIAEHASIEVDVRVSERAEQARIEAAWDALRAHDPRVVLTRHGGFDRPPMERGPQSRALYELARHAGASMGIDVAEGSTGGASDGNFTAALGIPTLDGLGADGDGAHARHEHVVIESLTDRAALAAAILLALDE